MTCEICKDTKKVFYSICSGHSVQELDLTGTCPRCKIGAWSTCTKCVEIPKVLTTALFDNIPDRFTIEGIATEDFFDDNGTHLGLSVEHVLSDLSIVLKSDIHYYMMNHEFKREDHQLYKLNGKRLRITVEVLEDTNETS